MKRLIAFALLLASPAEAQFATTTTTAPVADSTNRIASTQFVQQNIASPTNLSAAFDAAFCSTRGGILERAVAGWACTVPGTTGLPWVSNGTGADPAYQALTAVGIAAATITSTQVASGTITGGNIASATVANSNLANMANQTMKCNSAAGSGPPQDCNYPVVNIADPAYGAVGNGVTNNFTAIQSAFTAGSGNKIYIPAGTFAVTLPSATSLATPGSNTIIEGAGKNTSILKLSLTGTPLATAFLLNNPHVIFRNLTIQLNGDGTGTQQGILFQPGASDFQFQNVALTSNAVEGVLIGGSATNGDAIRVIFTSTGLAGSPITISSPITTAETTAQMATALAAAINANGPISGAGIVATAVGSFVSIAQSDNVVPSASYTTSVTGAATETMIIGPSATTVVWNIPQTGIEVNDFRAENADVSGWNYVLLKANATTTTNRRFTFRGGFYNQNITGHLNINSPSGTFDRLVIEGIHMGSVGLNNANDLPIGLSNITNATIAGNMLEGTYQQNAMHFEENSSGLTIVGNEVQQATSSALGVGYSGTCMYFVDNNVGGHGFLADNDVTITGNVCHGGGSNASGYGIYAAEVSTINQRWAIGGNVFTGYAGGTNLAISGFTFLGNTLVNIAASGTGITINGASLNGVVSDNLVKTYATEFSNAAGLTVEGIPQVFTPAITWGQTATFTVNTARVKTLRHTTQLALDFTISAAGTVAANSITWNIPNTSNSAIAINGREVALNGRGLSCTASSGATSVSCSRADNSNFSNSEHYELSGVYENQ